MNKIKKQWWLDIATWVLLPGLTSFIGLCLISVLSILDIDCSLGEDSLLLGGITIEMSAIFMAFQTFIIMRPSRFGSEWLVLMSFGGFALTILLGMMGLHIMANLDTFKGYKLALLIFFLVDTFWVAGCYIAHTRNIASAERRMEEEIERMGAPQ